MTRLVIIGASGSGKSRLAGMLGAAHGIAVHDLDTLHWLEDGRKRGEDAARALVAEAARGDCWIIEGVFGWLAEIALAQATGLVWLDPPWESCLDGLRRRGLKPGMSERDREELIVWAGAYWTRATSSSLVGHTRLYEAFAGPKARLRTRGEADAFTLPLPDALSRA